MIGELVGAFVARTLIRATGEAVATGVSAIYEGRSEVKEKQLAIQEKQLKIKNKEIELQRQQMSMKEMELAMRDNPDNFIRMRSNSENFRNMNYQDAVRSLAGMGFYHITIREIYVKKGPFDRFDYTGCVTGVIVNGMNSFNCYSTFSRDSYVIVNAIVHKPGCKLFMPGLGAIQSGQWILNRPVQRCQYCGVVVSQGQKYCIGCGAPV